MGSQVSGSDPGGWGTRNDNDVKKFYESHWRKHLTRIFKYGRESSLTNLKDFYDKLWNLQLPAKIAITIWRISWNYIPTLANLKHKRVSNDVACPRCGRGEEDITHIFRYCPATGEIWPLLDLSWISESTTQGFWEWITWVFRMKNRNRGELFLKVRNCIAELEGLRMKGCTLKPSSSHRHQEEGTRVTIQFDATFDSRNFKSTSGLVVWDGGGRLMTTKMVLHRNVQSPFAAETLAGLQAVKLGSEMEFPSVTVMGDSLTIIKKCKAMKRDKSAIGAIIHDIYNRIN
ncbi:hypothetical protein CXB51_000915 [Gossypium anomalum]|uniref:Reverse transcriptase n=1 Tax=Gossypium anomalum TaxID=47600 RepID=A0A8J6DEU1_9ROSI|nr:hypothetical protein CXB51_000915 [Gossypium anomalum]